MLRRKFTPPADSKLARLVFSLRADAGVCVFLNGALAYELRVIPGKGLAEKAIENPVSPPPVDEIALDPESLKEGENELSLIALRRTNDRAEFLSELRLEAWRTTGQFGADADALRQRLATLTAQANQLPGTRSAELLTYLEARILEAEGKIPEALRFFQTAFEQNKKRSVASQQSPRVDSTLWRPEPLLGVARCLEKQGKSADAELELRAALSLAGWGWKPSLWDEWLRLCFADLKLTAAETLAIVPTPPNENHVRPVNRHADTLWLLRMLNYGPQRDLRINCGGEPYWEGEEGETLWGGDHFFLGGYPECVARIYKTAPRQPFLEWVRVFEGGLLVPAYRVPLPSGQYSITVHCSFVTVRANQIWVPPQFDLRIEGEQHAASDGLLGTSTSLGPYKTRVADGALDIGLVCRSGDVVLGGIEIHRTGD